VASYDVGIVGAGIHGASAAFHLAQRGISTVIFEKGTPASGPTGRSSAVCRAYYTNPFLAEVAHESLQIFANFGDVTAGGDSGYRRTGAMFLHPAEDVPQLQQSAAQLNALGIKTEIVTGAALAAELPGFVIDDLAAGAWEPEAGYADPSGTTRGMMRRAVQLGAMLRNGARVRRIEMNGDVTVVTDDGDQTSVGRLLIAAGPWTAPLVRQVGFDLPLTVERHVVASYAWGAAAPIDFTFADLIGGYYLKPEGSEQYQLGPLEESPRSDPDDFAEELFDYESAELAERVINRVPRLAESEPRGGWASLYDVSPDWQPVIGQVAERVFVDAGTSGHGFKLGPAMGRYVADLVTGEKAAEGLEQFSPLRFAQDKLLTGGYGNVRILG
jgi:glycine/D-amino acid oxidase-like deaminating enzyme